MVDGVVYFGASDCNVYALNAADGTKLWSYKTGDYVESSPAVSDGVVYIGSNDGNLYALRTSNGHKLWSSPIDGVGSPVVVNGAVYAFSAVGCY